MKTMKAAKKFKNLSQNEVASILECRAGYQHWNRILDLPGDRIAWILGGMSTANPLQDFFNDLQEELYAFEELLEEADLPEGATLADLQKHLEDEREGG